MARILVIEDDKSMNDILVQTLEDDDHEVRAAFDGPDGIALCKVLPFDLVITDVRLPGMDGVEAISLMRQVQKQLRFIVITGYASADTPVRSIRLQVEDYLFKPFSLQYFLNSVNRVLDQDQSKKKKRALFSRLFSLLGRPAEKALDRKLEKLVYARQEAFRGLYVGVRSDYLSTRDALVIYSKLAELEAPFRALLNSPTPSEEALGEVAGKFEGVLNRLAMMKSGETEEQAETDLSDEEFTALNEAIKSSKIGLDDLMYAPLLRETPDERFETLPELLELKRSLWPATAV